MKKIKKTTGLILATGILAASALTGCGKAGSAESAPQTEEAKTVYVGVPNSFANDSFYDDDGELVGYEIELLRKIDELIPQYNFEYEPSDMGNILLGLDTGSLDMGAHQFETTEERKAKYLFGNQGYMIYDTYIAVLTDYPGADDIRSLADVAGKKVGSSSNISATAQKLENWNAEHPDQAVVIDYYGSLTTEALVAAFKAGNWDFIVTNQKGADTYNREYSEDGKDWIRLVGDTPVNETQAYFLFRNENADLQQAVDAAIITLKENGWLKELSDKWWQGDYVPEVN